MQTCTLTLTQPPLLHTLHTSEIKEHTVTSPTISWNTTPHVAQLCCQRTNNLCPSEAPSIHHTHLSHEAKECITTSWSWCKTLVTPHRIQFLRSETTPLMLAHNSLVAPMAPNMSTAELQAVIDEDELNIGNTKNSNTHSPQTYQGVITNELSSYVQFPMQKHM